MSDAASDTTPDIASDAVLRRLGELEAASDERRREMRSVLDQLPAALSRRRLVSAALADLRRAPRKLDGIMRALRKLGRRGAPRT